MKTKGYSIWLIPQDDTFKKLSKLINGLSRKYSSPIFDPHVTLIGGIIGSQDEVIKKTKKLASKVNPYAIELNKVGFLDNYLKSLFWKAKQDKEVLRANKWAKKIFNMKNSEKYLPHLSLIYGDFSENIKKEIIKNYQLDNFKLNFVADKIHLYNTNGEIKDWEKVGEFELTVSH